MYHFRGPKNFRTYQNFSNHRTHFPDITKFPTKLTQFLTKLTEFVPFFFIISQYCPTVERILPDLLCLPNNWGGGAGAKPCIKDHFNGSVRFSRPTVRPGRQREKKPGDSRVNRETWQLWNKGLFI